MYASINWCVLVFICLYMICVLYCNIACWYAYSYVWIHCIIAYRLCVYWNIWVLLVCTGIHVSASPLQATGRMLVDALTFYQFILGSNSGALCLCSESDLHLLFGMFRMAVSMTSRGLVGLLTRWSAIHSLQDMCPRVIHGQASGPTWGPWHQEMTPASADTWRFDIWCFHCNVYHFG